MGFGELEFVRLPCEQPQLGHAGYLGLFFLRPVSPRDTLPALCR